MTHSKERNARKRYSVGSLQGEIGTIVGPKDITGEYLVIFDEDGNVGYATTDELSASTARVSRGEIQSVTEHQWHQLVRGPQIDRFRSLFA